MTDWMELWERRLADAARRRGIGGGLARTGED